MKKLLTLTTFLILVLDTTAQTYSTLWKNVIDARNKDLPKTEIKALHQIANKANTEKAYGHLLKAQLMAADLEMNLAPDSAEVEKTKLEELYSKAKDKALRAIYATVLYRIYEFRDTAQCSLYQKAAIKDMDMLAKTDAGGYSPLIIDGKDSEIFGDDLLSIIGFTTKQYIPLYFYYKERGNRRAACISGLYAIKDRMDEDKARSMRKSPAMAALDSLINMYGDLDVAGEVAVERYNYMNRFSDVTAEDRIAYINYVLSKWGTWQRASELRNAQKQLTAPTLSLSIDKNVVQPNKSKIVKFNRIRNISELSFNVYSTSLNGNYKYFPDHASGYKYVKQYVSATPVQTVNRRYANHPDYAFFEDSLEIDGLPAGVYMIEATTMPQTQAIRRLYYVSEMGIVYIPLPDEKRRIVAVNTTTGQPISGAKVEIRYNSDNESAPHTILTTDEKGEIVISEKGKSIFTMRAFTSNDMASPMTNANDGGFYWNNNYKNNHEETTDIFTDRAIYRPGQTVHASAIVFKKTSTTDYEVVSGRQITATLRDANGKEIANKTLTTDDFGSCAVDFVLPENTLNGYFSLCVNNRSKSFRVESYKRPTFTIDFPKINEKYSLGDTLVVKATATAYAGIAVQGATVKYEVTRRNAYWWWRINGSNSSGSEKIYQGEATTDQNGNAIVTIPLVADEIPSDNSPRFYNFTATATVTDLAGETHEAELTVPIGSKPTAFTVDLPDKVLADNLNKVTFKLYNSTGADIHANVKYSVDGGAMQQAKTTEPIFLGSLPSGKHELFAICEVDTLRKSFTVFNLDDEKPAVETNDWFYVSDDKFHNDGSPVTIQVGSSAKDIHILYTLIAEDKLIESGYVDKSSSLLNRKLAYKKEYGDAVRIDFAWVKDGTYYTHSAKLTRPEKTSTLKMEWTTFRDRLTPGQKEEWTLRITNPDGTPAKAQALLTMYDKALDQIEAHSLDLYKPSGITMPWTSWGHASIHRIYGQGYRSPSRMSYRNLSLSHFDNEVYPFYGYGEFLSARSFVTQSSRRTRGGVMRAKEMMSIEESADVLVFDAIDNNGNSALVKLDADVKPEFEAKAAGYDGNDNEVSIQIRGNLNETAFFMPQLVTDSTGEVKIKFTLPESLTTWKLLGVSHTQDMTTGKIEGEAVAQKSLMIVPNVPRFVRQSDKATIVARIYNNVENTLEGTAIMQLIDPATEKIVMTNSSRYNAAALSTTTATFSFDIPSDYQMLICRISAVGNGFSDGEQHYLPILQEKELVTETRNISPALFCGKDVKLPSSDCYRMTVEYTENPSWLAYQALPQLSNPNDNNAISLAASIYANALGRKIVNDAPASLKSQFEQWKSENSLSSNLLKNEELKDILINETPWLADANSETETKQRMGEFFDHTAIDYRISTAAQKLRTLLTDDNMWSWWKGMDGSPYITVEVVKMMARLESIGIVVDELKDDIESARRSLDKYIVKKVEWMKSEESKGYKQSFPYGVTLDYLYINAIAPTKQSSEANSACNYLIEKLRKETKYQSIGDKATTAIILNANGNKSQAKEYVQSLKEYTVYKDEMGRYYDTPKAEYSWRDYRIPTQVAAIEALRTINPSDSITIAQMTQWLLAQKRTQSWDTPINTVNAVYALSLEGMPKGKLTYVKKSYDKPKAKSVTLDIPSDKNLWGAIYVQRWQKSNEVKNSSTGLSIKRDIIDEKGKSAKTFVVGEKVKVRLTIKVDRDLNFVSVVDRRPASMEPINQTSGYCNSKYISPKDNATYYYFDRMSKGTHTIETEYTIDRAGTYTLGTATAQCVYAPEFRATASGVTIKCQ